MKHETYSMITAEEYKSKRGKRVGAKPISRWGICKMYEQPRFKVGKDVRRQSIPETKK